MKRTKVENGICLFQLWGDKPPLDGALPQLRQLEYHERRCGCRDTAKPGFPVGKAPHLPGRRGSPR